MFLIQDLLRLIPHHLFLVLFSNPFNWFEVTIKFLIGFEVYVSVLGFTFDYSIDWQVGPPIKLTPQPFDKVGDISSSGTVLLQMSDLICESKGGSL